MTNLIWMKYYRESMCGFEKRTDEIVKEISAIVPSMLALETALLISEGSLPTQKTYKLMSSSKNTPSKNSVLNRELSRLVASVNTLKRVMKNNINEAISRSNSVLQHEQSVEYEAIDPATLQGFHQFQKSLIKSILILDSLDQDCSRTKL